MIKLNKGKIGYIFTYNNSFEDQIRNKNNNTINKNYLSFLLKNSKKNNIQNKINKKKFINLLNISNTNSSENSFRNKLLTSKIQIKSRNKIINENNNNDNNNLNFCVTDINPKKTFKESSIQTSFNNNKNNIDNFLQQKKFEFYGLLSKKNKNNFIENSKNKLYSIKTNTKFNIPIIENPNKKILFKNRILKNINKNKNVININNTHINSFNERNFFKDNKNILIKKNKIKNLTTREINLMNNPESYLYQIYHGIEYLNKIKKEELENKNLKKKKKEYLENYEKMRKPANNILNKLKLDFVLDDEQKKKGIISSKTFLDFNIRMKF